MNDDADDDDDDDDDDHADADHDDDNDQIRSIVPSEPEVEVALINICIYMDR